MAGGEGAEWLPSLLSRWSKTAGFEIEVEEWDISNGAEFDLLQEEKRQRILESLRRGDYMAVLMSPPCGTWSRAPWANQFGPRPLRSAFHPWGFPWLEGVRLKKVADSNCFIRFCLEVLEVIRVEKMNVKFWWEHPEDLGMVVTYKRKARTMWFRKLHAQVRPASIWQLDSLRQFYTIPGTFTRTFHQCVFGASSPKPTRIWTNLESFAVLGFQGWPVLDQHGFYQGPLPRQCSCGRQHKQLIAKNSQGNFLTTEAAAYPPKMDWFLAEAIWTVASDHHNSSLKKAVVAKNVEVDKRPQNKEEKLSSKEAEIGEVGDEKKPSNKEGNEKKKKEKEDSIQPPLQQGAKSSGEDGNEEKKHEEEKDDTPLPAQRGVKRHGQADFGKEPGKKRRQSSLKEQMLALPHKAGALQVWYKGKTRRMVDGLGKCSPGIRPAGSRDHPGTKASVVLADAFWKEVVELVDSMPREERLKMVAKISLGKYECSPFGETIEGIKARMDKLVETLGKNPSRRCQDRRSEINFRRLAAWAGIVGDEDDRYLPTLAARGVPLGARNEIGRVTTAYDPKKKEEEDGIPMGWTEDFEHANRDNYISATSHMEMVKRHIQEDVQKGWITSMTLKEAKEKFGEELQVASLGAVPKDRQWSDVRVVHDGTHGIQVNSKILQPNKMEFPQFDDLQAALRAFQRWGPVQKLLVAFDIKSAHRLIPIQEEDWGLQAFKLDDTDEVFLNRVGTFGITTASFWWGRLAATLFRTFHRVIPRHSLFYLLLFADDGLALVGGEEYHYLVLGIFIYLEVMEVPLSWKKTRGGFKTEWIGYSVDIDRWLIGVSDRKVQWLSDWVRATNSEGRLLGRDFKAGIGRMGFLAGAIRGARPFLAPLYAASARVGNTAFVDLHMAIKISLEFFLDWLREEPMKPPCDPPGVAGEVFRVDAMASEQGIMIGGWETFETSDTSKARWFSVELTTKKAPMHRGSSSAENRIGL